MATDLLRKTPRRAWGEQEREMWYFPFNALTQLDNRKGIRPVKQLGVGLLVVMIWLELQLSPPLPSSLASIKPANLGLPGKMAVKTESYSVVMVVLLHYTLSLAA